MRESYTLMHTYQTVESVRQRREKWCRFDHAEMPIMDALLMLDNLVDDSDPDVRACGGGGGGSYIPILK